MIAMNRKGIRNRERPSLLVVACLSLLGSSLCLRMQASGSPISNVATRVKAAFIYNFARFVEWPPRAGSAPFHIAVMGKGELAAPLEEVIRGKLTNGRPITISYVRSAAEAECCEILLIESSEARHMTEIAQALSEKPVLTVCDSANCQHDGGMIAFQVVEESVRFQINQEAAEHAGLKISSQLLKVAIPNGGKRP